jgi:hypothetical protein
MQEQYITVLIMIDASSDFYLKYLKLYFRSFILYAVNLKKENVTIFIKKNIEDNFPLM